MTITDTELEAVLVGLLQKDLKFFINNKQYRKGKFILFRQNNYHIELTVRKGETEIKRFEIPIPFGIEEHRKDGLVYFDYRLMTLAQKDKQIYRMLKDLPTEGTSKFYDKILEIQIEDEV